MILDRLEQIVEGMRNNITVTIIAGHTINKAQVATTFDYKNGKGDFSVIFYNLKPMIITFAKKKTVPPKFISFTLEDDFSIDVFLDHDKYLHLTELLGIEFVANGKKFKPSEFFNDFNKCIPDYKNTLNYNQHSNIEHFSEYVKVEDEKKTKFIDFHQNNGTTKNVTEKNLNKTRLYFGDEVAEQCSRKNGNISSWWEEPYNLN